MADRLRGIGTNAKLVRMAESASRDETKHAGYCAEEAARFGKTVDTAPVVPSEIAPPELQGWRRTLYEVTASCMAETESTAMLVTLIGATPSTRMKSLLREFAEDEVKHARFGWAVLAAHKERDDLSYLSQWVPWMLRTTAGDSFKHAAGPEDPELLELGVLPFTARRKVFIDSLEGVIFPGLEALGIDTAESRAWLGEATTPAK